MNFVMNHTLGAGSIARPADQRASTVARMSPVTHNDTGVPSDKLDHAQWKLLRRWLNYKKMSSSKKICQPGDIFPPSHVIVVIILPLQRFTVNGTIIGYHSPIYQQNTESWRNIHHSWRGRFPGNFCHYWQRFRFPAFSISHSHSSPFLWLNGTKIPFQPIRARHVITQNAQQTGSDIVCCCIEEMKRKYSCDVTAVYIWGTDSFLQHSQTFKVIWRASEM